jgi:hypothetical protein
LVGAHEAPDAAPTPAPAAITRLGPFVRNYIARRAGAKPLDPIIFETEETWRRWFERAIDEIKAGKRKGAKPRSLINYEQARRSLCDYFGESKPLADKTGRSAITDADAKDWRLWMASDTAARKIGNKDQPLMPNTYNRRCGFARQFFNYAVEARLISANPFNVLKGITVKANKSRDFIVTPEIAAKVIDAMPDAKHRLVFALARFGGLRCPREHQVLTWGDMDWAANRFRVNSPEDGRAVHSNLSRVAAILGGRLRPGDLPPERASPVRRAGDRPSATR